MILLTQTHHAFPTDSVSVAMIPAPNFQLKYNLASDTNQTTLANTISASQRLLGSNLVGAERALAELKAQVYAQKPDLYAIEQYREIPRRWFENRSREVMLLQNQDAAINAMRDLLVISALEDLLTNGNFAPFVTKTVQSFPPEFQAELFTNSMVAQADSKIGYAAMRSAVTNISVNPSEYVTYTLSEINARRPYLAKALQHEKEKFQVDDAFVATLRVKLAVDALMGFADYYIGFNTPPRLDKERTKVRKLRIEFANAAK